MATGCGPLLGYVAVQLTVRSAVINVTPSCSIVGTPLSDQQLEQKFLSRTIIQNHIRLNYNALKTQVSGLIGLSSVIPILTFRDLGQSATVLIGCEPFRTTWASYKVIGKSSYHVLMTHT